MPAADLPWTAADEAVVLDDAFWPDLGWPASISRESVLNWRRMFRREAKAWRQKPWRPRVRVKKTEAELRQLLQYLEGFPEAQQAAIAAHRESQVEDTWKVERPQAPRATITAEEFVEAFGPKGSKAVLHLEAMTDAAMQALERLMLLRELDEEFETLGADVPPIEGAPDINTLIADVSAAIKLFNETKAAIDNQTEGE